MAINQIDSTLKIDTLRSEARGSSGGDGNENSFDQILSTAEGAKAAPVNAETAAEILRLQMLRSAVSLADNDTGGNYLPTSTTISQALAKFLEQEQQQSSTKTGDKQELVLPVPPDADITITAPDAADPSLEAIISRASKRYGVHEGLIKAVIKAESNFNVTAVSHAGAKGLMQLMPSTARGLGVTDSFDPEQNVMAGTRFLKDMLNRYGGDVDSALAAYNWGPGNVDKRGDSLPRETREYLTKVKKYFNDYIA